MADKKPEGTSCPTCHRKVRSGMTCRQTLCWFQKTVNRDGVPVLARPLTQRWLL